CLCREIFRFIRSVYAMGDGDLRRVDKGFSIKTQAVAALRVTRETINIPIMIINAIQCQFAISFCGYLNRIEYGGEGVILALQGKGKVIKPRHHSVHLWMRGDCLC